MYLPSIIVLLLSFRAIHAPNPGQHQQGQQQQHPPQQEQQQNQQEYQQQPPPPQQQQPPQAQVPQHIQQQQREMAAMTREQRARAAAEAKAAEARKFAEHNEVHDASHIQEHLDGQAEVDTSKMTREQLQFHYFTMHDLNKDNRLDGLEIIKAVTHWHKEEGQEAPPRANDDELEAIVDSVLKETDSNSDGYVDYPEFVQMNEAKSRKAQNEAAQAPPPAPPAPPAQPAQ